MYKIVCKKELNSAVTYMEIEAPFVARKAKAGQFIIFRVDEKSERVPLTIAGYDREKGTVSIIFQKVGLSTELLGSMNEGDLITKVRENIFPTLSDRLASPQTSRVKSASAWSAAVLAARSHIRLQKRSKRRALRPM